MPRTTLSYHSSFSQYSLKVLEMKKEIFSASEFKSNIFIKLNSPSLKPGLRESRLYSKFRGMSITIGKKT